MTNPRDINESEMSLFDEAERQRDDALDALDALRKEKAVEVEEIRRARDEAIEGQIVLLDMIGELAALCGIEWDEETEDERAREVVDTVKRRLGTRASAPEGNDDASR